jgi:hypothetical protein
VKVHTGRTPAAHLSDRVMFAMSEFVSRTFPHQLQ